MDTRLKKGLDHFKEISYKKYAQLYYSLKDQQHPHTLFIACSDSRVSPEMLTDSQPGEVFVVRNIANTVPVFSKSEHDLTTASAIEFAVEVLGVKQIIICGHSNCGGCAAALEGTENVSHLPFTQKYLEPLKVVRETIEKEEPTLSESEKVELMEKTNVIEQLNHLKEYPIIQKRLKTKEITVEGWHYNIGIGEVHVYDERLETFLPAESIVVD